MRPHCCNRPTNLHGTSHGRRRYRYPICRTVTVHPLLRGTNHWTDPSGCPCTYLGINHPLANSGGWQYDHRLAVATALGRSLRTDEHVHHIDTRPTNNTLPNLELLAVAYHGRLHASAATLAGYRDDLGRFTEHTTPIGPFSWPRWGPILGSRC